jgi:hypothetical protein
MAAYIMSRVDPRMSVLFTQGFWQLNDINRYANALQFGERVVYWQADGSIFPLSHFGGRAGNAGRCLRETIPAYGMNLIECEISYIDPVICRISESLGPFTG